MGGGNNTNPHAQGMKWLKRRKKKMKRMNEERMQWKEDEEDEEGEEREKKNGLLEINKTDISLGKRKKKRKTKTVSWETNRTRKRREEEAKETEEAKRDGKPTGTTGLSGGGNTTHVNNTKNPFAVLRQLPRLER